LLLGTALRIACWGEYGRAIGRAILLPDMMAGRNNLPLLQQVVWSGGCWCVQEKLKVMNSTAAELRLYTT
jgi:hypothetical protein